MSERALIHVGLPKCGSTALQKRAQANAARLLEQGIFYPDTGDAERSKGQPGHMPLAGELATLSRSGGGPSPLLADMLPSFRACGARTLFLSSESFAKRLGGVATELLLPLAGFEVELLLIFRRADRLALSAYNQAVRGRRHTGSFADFVARPDKPDAIYPDIPRLLRGLRARFPAAQRHVHDLDAPPGHDSIGHAEALLGVAMSLPPEGARFPDNASLSDTRTLFLLACNRSPLSTAALKDVRQALRSLPDDPGDRGTLMNRADSRQLLRAFAVRNAALSTDHGVVLARHEPDRTLARRRRITLTGAEYAMVFEQVAPLLRRGVRDALHAAIG